MIAPLLETRGLTKRFGAVVALDSVDLDVRAGEVHAVLGENGAGKTTLMNLLFGLLVPSGGRLAWRGEDVRLAGARDARALGIGMVHQHFMLVGALTVWENVALSDPEQAGFRLDPARGRSRVRELGERFRMTLDPDARLDDLPVGARQRVELAKALARSVALLILDEPTAVLAPSEVDDLFAIVRALRAEGTAVLFVSHKLDEVLAISDRITVLRRGRVVERTAAAQADAASLAHAIVGAELAAGEARGHEASRSTATGNPVLAVQDLVHRAAGRVGVDRVSFDVRAGEVLGIAGVDGNGQEELVALLAGLERPERGTIRLDDEDIVARSVEARWQRGLSVIPGDRGRDGLVLDAAVWENLALREFGALWARGVIGVRPDRHRERATQLLERFDVRGASATAHARSLSGGNQQKLLLARELERKPRALVILNPTRGLDVGASRALWTLLEELRRAGGAIVLVSTELEKLLAVADRVAVLFRGRLAASSKDRAELGARMLGRSP